MQCVTCLLEITVPGIVTALTVLFQKQKTASNTCHSLLQDGLGKISGLFKLCCMLSVIGNFMWHVYLPIYIPGVLFTIDPLSGNPSNMMINANYGLGEVGYRHDR